VGKLEYALFVMLHDDCETARRWPAYVVHAAALGYDSYGYYGYGSVGTAICA